MENVRRFADDFMVRFGICMAQDAAIEHMPIDPDRSTDKLRKFRVCRTGFAVRESGSAVSDECDELISELSDAGGWLELRDASDDASPPLRADSAMAGGLGRAMSVMPPVPPAAASAASASLPSRDVIAGASGGSRGAGVGSSPSPLGGGVGPRSVHSGSSSGHERTFRVRPASLLPLVLVPPAAKGWPLNVELQSTSPTRNDSEMVRLKLAQGPGPQATSSS